MNQKNQTALDKLQARLERKLSIAEPDGKLDLTDTLEDALGEVLDYCNRNELVGNMASCVSDLVIIRMNREGTEGELSRTEGGVSISYDKDIPQNIKTRLNRYRLGRMRSFS